MPVRQPRYTKEEAARRGDEIYDRDIRPQVEASNKGKYVAIDIETGAWEMDESEIAAGDRLRLRIPDAQTWMTRVGFGYTRSYGGGYSEKRMITGSVNVDRELIIRLTLHDTNGQEHECDVLVDTGFTAWLTLPPDVIGALGLSWREWSAATLADGSRVAFDVYTATIIWDGQVIHIPVDKADAHPLAGMSLMDGYRIIIEDVDGGRVTIEHM